MLDRTLITPNNKFIINIEKHDQPVVFQAYQGFKRTSVHGVVNIASNRVFVLSLIRIFFEKRNLIN